MGPNKKADWYDPGINAKDDLLDNVDKETLTFNGGLMTIGIKHNKCLKPGK